MTQGLIVAAACAVLSFGWLLPAAAAQEGERAVAVIERVEGGRTLYEITGTGFRANRPVRIEALNLTTREGRMFEVMPTGGAFAGVFIGKEADGSYYTVAAGTWRVRAKSGLTGAKARFTVSAKLPLGTWGGERLGLEVSEQGARLEYDCAHGTIDEPIVPDASGRFEATGVHYREHGGPVNVDIPAETHPARYTGRTDGKTMTLTVELTDTGETLGTFALTYGEPPMILKCL
jgi:hypothetical protein